MRLGDLYQPEHILNLSVFASHEIRNLLVHDMIGLDGFSFGWMASRRCDVIHDRKTETNAM